MIDIIDKDNMFKSISDFPDNIIDAIKVVIEKVKEQGE